MNYRHRSIERKDAQFAADMQMAYDLQEQEEVAHQLARANQDEYSRFDLNEEPFSQALDNRPRRGSTTTTTTTTTSGPAMPLASSFSGNGIPVVQGRPVSSHYSSLFGSPAHRRSSSGAHAAISSDGLAMQHNQSLLYVAAEIGNRMVEMMVDTGAQSSVISAQLMRTLDLQSKMNHQMQGVAQGVGQARILGVIQNCPVSIGHVEFLLYFLVLDIPQDMMIMGIDQMRRFKCQIDLENNKVCFPLFAIRHRHIFFVQRH